MPGTLRIQANSQTLSVNLTRLDGTAASVFSNFGLSTPVTLPATISSDTSFYMPAPETYIISVKSNGSEIASDHGTALTQVLPEGRVLVIAPSIDPLERPTVDGGTFASAWKANTAVLAGQPVIAPTGEVVTAKTAFTTGATFVPANWTYPLQGQSSVAEYTVSTLAVPVPNGVVGCRVTVLSGGSGGGSGRRGAAASTRTGGSGGGSGGMIQDSFFPASMLGATYDVTVGAGGAGGAAVTADNTNGNAGVAGGASTFVSGSLTFRSSGGNASQGGSTAAATGGGAGGGVPAGSPGGNSATSGVGTNGATNFNGAPGGGGAGGSISSADSPSAGSAGGSSSAYSTTAGTAGAVDSTLPSGGVAVGGGLKAPGPGAGGGAASITQAAQAGATPNGFGGGGGGGGASLNGFTSGAGGAGASGFVRVTFLW